MRESDSAECSYLAKNLIAYLHRDLAANLRCNWAENLSTRNAPCLVAISSEPLHPIFAVILLCERFYRKIPAQL